MFHVEPVVRPRAMGRTTAPPAAPSPSPTPRTAHRGGRVGSVVRSRIAAPRARRTGGAGSAQHR